jgi:hypothetical protein
MRALVKLPDVVELLRKEKMPAELKDLAFKYANDGINVSELGPDDMIQFVRFTYELVANMVKWLSPPPAPGEVGAWDEFKRTGNSPSVEGWQAVTLDAREIRELDIDQADIEALGRIAGRQATPNEITALSRFDRGLITDAEAAIAAAAEPGATVGDLAPFRGQSTGDGARADGEDVRDATVRTRSSSGPGGRASVRRGDRA